jgi:hypothetical protein
MRATCSGPIVLAGFANGAQKNPMSSMRTTNLFLAIIAACLLAIVGKTVVPDLLPSAYAATAMKVEGPVAAYLHGCASYSFNECSKWAPVVINGQGSLLVQSK